MNQTEHDNLEHGTIIVDADSHFNINIETRAITNSENRKTSLIQYDHNSERFSFDIARYIEGHDLLLCNQVQVHYLNISGSGKGKTPGVYPVTDLSIHPSDNNKVCFTWLISENATRYNGSLHFLISFACVKEDEVLYRWNSGIYTAITIVTGINNSDDIVENYADVLLEWEKRLAEDFDDLKTTLYDTDLPAMIDERLVEREFASSEEVEAIFTTSDDNESGSSAGETVTHTYGTVAYVTNSSAGAGSRDNTNNTIFNESITLSTVEDAIHIKNNTPNFLHWNTEADDSGQTIYDTDYIKITCEDGVYKLYVIEYSYVDPVYTWSGTPIFYAIFSDDSSSSSTTTEISTAVVAFTNSSGNTTTNGFSQQTDTMFVLNENSVVTDAISMINGTAVVYFSQDDGSTIETDLTSYLYSTVYFSYNSVWDQTSLKYQNNTLCSWSGTNATIYVKAK